ncbi:MAG: hypothetical protein HW391_931 [Chloroflexi bacterium]|nr:hypothetical protein [Chloroflexota bacterium]
MAWTSPVRWRLKSSIGITWLWPPPAAPPLIPNTGPRLGWRMQTAALRPIRLRPWARPTVVVLLPSPRGVGLMAVTTTYLPRGRSASSRSIAERRILALVKPYGSTSSSRSPRSRATSMIGRGVTDRAMSRSDGKVIRFLERSRLNARRPDAGLRERDGRAAGRWSAGQPRPAPARWRRQLRGRTPYRRHRRGARPRR